MVEWSTEHDKLTPMLLVYKREHGVFLKGSESLTKAQPKASMDFGA